MNILDLFHPFNPTTPSPKYEKGYRYGHGKAMCIVRPKTTAEVCSILKICNEHKIGVVPQGGNTGLVGASNPDSSGTQIVLSTELLNKDIYQLDVKNKTMRVGAGFVLDELNAKLADDDLFLPIDIGSSGSCNIGGLIATNAAGGRSGRYGNMGSRVVEVEVASCELQVASKAYQLATCNSQLATLVQDNSKIDFANPFIGSQGWLGIVTEAVVRLEERPKQSDSIILVPRDIAAINTIREKFASTFGNGFTAFEGMSDVALQLVAKHIPNTKYLFADDKITQNYALLIEVSSVDADEDLQGKLLAVFDELMSSGAVVTGLQGKAEIYWHNRHHISEAISKAGSVIATDIAVADINKLGIFREEMTRDLQKKYPHLIIAPFGHEMIGAAHFNMVWPKDSPREITQEDKRAIQELIYDKVVNEYHGTYSTEHGIGPHNQWAYDKYTPEEIKRAAGELKKKFDPNGVMNPNVRY